VYYVGASTLLRSGDSLERLMRRAAQAAVESGLTPGIGIGFWSRSTGSIEAVAGLAETGSELLTKSTVWPLNSITKVLLASCVLALVDNGTLRLEEPANVFLKSAEIAPARRGGLTPTIQQLLSHTSGLPPHVEMVNRLRHGRVRPEYAGPVVCVLEPGSGYLYSTHNYSLLALAIEDTLGIHAEEVIEVTILRPLRMNATSLSRSPPVPLDGFRCVTGHIRNADDEFVPARVEPAMVPASTGAFSTLGDLLKLGGALLDADASFLRPGTAALMWSDLSDGFSPGSSRAVCFGLRSLFGHTLAWQHSYGPATSGTLQFVPTDAERSCVVVLLNTDAVRPADRLADFVVRHAYGWPNPTAELPRQVRRVTTREIRRLQGLYLPASLSGGDERKSLSIQIGASSDTRGLILTLKKRGRPADRQAQLLPVSTAAEATYIMPSAGFGFGFGHGESPCTIQFKHTQRENPSLVTDSGAVFVRVARGASNSQLPMVPATGETPYDGDE
jgi:CubicO group peptidase (beta-lactamase class C family)